LVTVAPESQTTTSAPFPVGSLTFFAEHLHYAQLFNRNILKLIFYSCGVAIWVKCLIFQESRARFHPNVVPR
jgi:surface polysaccharide O-acyltransferase-like enzyme